MIMKWDDLMELLQNMHTTFDRFQTYMKETIHKFKESCINRGMSPIIQNEYTNNIHAWYEFEDDFDDWYMNNLSIYLWDDNYFHLLFDDFSPPYIDNIIDGSQ